MNRFFTKKENVFADEILIDNPEDVHHINHVLRLKTGAVMEISDSAEWEYTVRISSVTGDGVRSKILDKQKFSREPEIKITLFQCLPKQGKMENIIQKSVELGVSRIVPVISARTIAAGHGDFAKKAARWQKVACEAVKQCRRGVVPEVAGATPFSATVDAFGAGGFDMAIFPYENEEKYSIKDALRNIAVSPRTLAVAIGPEGGYSDEEAEALKAVGAKSVSLGKAVLRTETAGPAAIAMIMYELEL